MSSAEEMAINRVLGRELKRLRKARNLKQSELAPRLKLDQASLSRVEAGLQYLSAAQLVVANSIFAVDLSASITRAQI